jgi:hypothetical protein
MKKYYKAVSAWLASQGHSRTPQQVADTERRAFERLTPELKKMRWPVPVTEEGRSVCMDILLCPCRTL